MVDSAQWRRQDLVRGGHETKRVILLDRQPHGVEFRVCAALE